MTFAIAAVGVSSFAYHALFLVHITAVAVAFGVPLTYAAVTRVARANGGGAGRAVADINIEMHKRQSIPALIVALVAGMGLIGVSDGVYKFEDAWVSAAFTVVLLLIALSIFVMLPALNRSAELASSSNVDAGEAKKVKGRIAMSTGIFHLGIVVTMVLMIWKPGN